MSMHFICADLLWSEKLAQIQQLVYTIETRLLLSSFVFASQFLLFAERICNILWCSLIFIANTFTLVDIIAKWTVSTNHTKALASFHWKLIFHFINNITNNSMNMKSNIRQNAKYKLWAISKIYRHSSASYTCH